jgi:hypothetical protein
MMQKPGPGTIIALAVTALVICGPGFWIGFHFPFIAGLVFTAAWGVVIGTLCGYYFQEPTYRAGKAVIRVDMKHFKEALIVFGLAMGGYIVGFVIHQAVQSWLR